MLGGVRRQPRGDRVVKTLGVATEPGEGNAGFVNNRDFISDLV